MSSVGATDQPQQPVPSWKTITDPLEQFKMQTQETFQEWIVEKKVSSDFKGPLHFSKHIRETILKNGGYGLQDASMRADAFLNRKRQELLGLLGKFESMEVLAHLAKQFNEEQSRNEELIKDLSLKVSEKSAKVSHLMKELDESRDKYSSIERRKNELEILVDNILELKRQRDGSDSRILSLEKMLDMQSFAEAPRFGEKYSAELWNVETFFEMWRAWIDMLIFQSGDREDEKQIEKMFSSGIREVDETVYRPYKRTLLAKIYEYQGLGQITVANLEAKGILDGRRWALVEESTLLGMKIAKYETELRGIEQKSVRLASGVIFLLEQLQRNEIEVQDIIDRHREKLGGTFEDIVETISQIMRDLGVTKTRLEADLLLKKEAMMKLSRDLEIKRKYDRLHVESLLLKKYGQQQLV